MQATDPSLFASNLLSRSASFSTAIQFNFATTAYAQQTVTVPLTFTPVSAGATAGSGAIVRLIADGTNAPTFPGFKESVGSAQYDNRAGVLNVVQFIFDGTDYWYSVFQQLGVTTAPPVDTTPPVLVGVSISSAAPARIVLQYGEALNPARIPATSAFTVSTKTVASVALASGSTSQLWVNLNSGFTGGQTGTISYTPPGTNAIQDAAGNLSAAFSNQAFSLPADPPSDTTPPSLTGVAIAPETPSRITLTYNEALKTSTVPAASAFTFTNGLAATAVSLSGLTVLVDFSPALAAGSSSTVSYAPPGTNPLQDAAGNLCAAFGSQAFSLPAVQTGAETLVFSTRTSNITQAGNGELTATAPSYATTYALGDKYIPANTDGWVSMDYLTTENRDAIMGFNTVPVNEQYQGFEYFVWAGNSTGAIRGATNGNTNNADVGASIAVGDILRLGRFSGTIKLQRSQNAGSSWSDLKVFDSNSAAFYICIAMNKTKLSNPLISGGIPR